MCKSHENWIEVRETEGEESKITFVRLDRVKEISIVESASNYINVIISTSNQEYLANTLETEREAKMYAYQIIKDIEDLK